MFHKIHFCVYLMIISSIYIVNSTKVVIIGAGLSGYSAAAKLMENGMDDIIILEAENRIGGRIHSISFGEGKFLDLGAQWCHGQKGNVIYELVSPHFNFGSSKFDDRESIFRISSGSDSEDIQEQADELLEIAMDIIFDSYDKMEKFNGSLGEFFTTNYQKTIDKPKYSEISKEMKSLVFDLTQKIVVTFWASTDWNEISRKLDMRTSDTGGDQDLTWKTFGFKTVFDFINKKRPNPSKHLNVDSKIQLNKEVINIQWNPNGKNEKIIITCSDDSKYEADHVIFTASLGVLKDRHNKLFTPNLPQDKVKAIINSGFGTLDKIFLEFSEPFWPYDDQNFSGYSFLWTTGDIEKIKNTEKSWLIDIPGFDRVDAFPNLVEFFYAGKHVKEFENFSDEKLTNDVIWLLEKFLGKTIPKPKQMIRTKWQSNKNFLGSYSFNSMDAQKSQITPEILAKPLQDESGKPKILFAGEATSKKFPSYAHGAVLSGWEVGKFLVDKM